MKKIIVLLIIYLHMIIFSSVDVFAKKLPEQDSLTTAFGMLQSLEIVQEPKSKWEQDDLIQRRDIFEMVYIIKNGNKELATADSNFQEKKYDFYKNSVEAKLTYNNPDGFDGFADVEENTYDDYLTYTLFLHGLIKGKQEGDKIIADLDEYITYNEALAIIGRLFDKETRFVDEYRELFAKNKDAYYEFLCMKGLINSETDPYTFTVTESMLNEKILAYTALYLVYKALYIPTTLDGWTSIPSYYYINNFMCHEEM